MERRPLGNARPPGIAGDQPLQAGLLGDQRAVFAAGGLQPLQDLRHRLRFEQCQKCRGRGALRPEVDLRVDVARPHHATREIAREGEISERGRDLGAGPVFRLAGGEGRLDARQVVAPRGQALGGAVGDRGDERLGPARARLGPEGRIAAGGEEAVDGVPGRRGERRSLGREVAPEGLGTGRERGCGRQGGRRRRRRDGSLLGRYRRRGQGRAEDQNRRRRAKMSAEIHACLFFVSLVTGNLPRTPHENKLRRRFRRLALTPH